jgi:hypothetical protein
MNRKKILKKIIKGKKISLESILSQKKGGSFFTIIPDGKNTRIYFSASFQTIKLKGIGFIILIIFLIGYFVLIERKINSSDVASLFSYLFQTIYN